jgi:hypothetical protein
VCRNSRHLTNGTYRIQCWGASGGGLVNIKSYGAYTEGSINLISNNMFFIYVGGKGTMGTFTGNRTSDATFNGGGGYIEYCDNNCISGGGYYGGKSGEVSSAGGSSFISGYTGCNAISESSTENNIIHTGQPNHYSGCVFTNSVMNLCHHLVEVQKLDIPEMDIVLYLGYHKYFKNPLQDVAKDFLYYLYVFILQFSSRQHIFFPTRSSLLHGTTYDYP